MGAFDAYARYVTTDVFLESHLAASLLGLTERAGAVEATWRQTGGAVEHGRVHYRVRGGRLTEYRIDFHHDEGAPR